LFQAKDSLFIWFPEEWAFISPEDSGTDIGEMPGIVLLNMGDLGQLFRRPRHILQQFLLIIYSLYLQRIIGYLTTIFITIGEAGIVIITGIIRVSTEIMVSIAGIIIIDPVMTAIMTGITTGVGLMTKLFTINECATIGIVCVTIRIVPVIK
jgi:hypothetical protein